MSVNRLIEWRARQIEDPIQRLKYLRSATRPGAALRRAKSWRPRHWKVVALAVVLASTAISAYTFSRHPNQTEVVLRLDRAPLSGGTQVTPNVWIVESAKDYETYSNGLRIEKIYTVTSEHRASYPVFGRRDVKATPLEWRTQPAGIVFHTTESLVVPFEPEQTNHIERAAGGVLDFVKKNHSYHYVIDRFGKVFRIVPESDIANHAGLSIWGDERFAYVNLNHSFIGVAFDTQTQREQDSAIATSAQIHSARVLTEMLRSRYGIPAGNCVTHAQVSVNPSNMLVGYHTDWAGNFPFSALGLDDNYVEPPASIDTFGFTYDSSLINSTGSRYWQGLLLADEQARARAVSQGLAPNQYQKILRQNYKQILAALKTDAVNKENSNEKQ